MVFGPRCCSVYCWTVKWWQKGLYYNAMTLHEHKAWAIHSFIDRSNDIVAILLFQWLTIDVIGGYSGLLFWLQQQQSFLKQPLQNIRTLMLQSILFLIEYFLSNYRRNDCKSSISSGFTRQYFQGSSAFPPSALRSLGILVCKSIYTFFNGF